MALVFHDDHHRTGLRHRLWELLAAVIAFLLVVLWTRPAG